MAKLAKLITGSLLFAELQASHAAEANPSTAQGFLPKYMTGMIVDDKPALHSAPQVQDSYAFTSAREEEKAAEKLLANGSNTPITLSAIGVGLLALVTMLGVRIQRGLRPDTALAGMEMQSQAQVSAVPNKSRQFAFDSRNAELMHGFIVTLAASDAAYHYVRQAMLKANHVEDELTWNPLNQPAVFLVPPERARPKAQNAAAPVGDQQKTGLAENLQNIFDPVGDGFMTALRVGTCALMIHHGIDKVVNVDGFSANVVAKFFGFLPGPPQFWTLSAAATQVVGAGFLAVGLFSRPAAAAMTATMLTAVIFHLENTGPEGFPLAVVKQHSYNYELAAMYVLVLGYFSIAGAGPWSLDEQVLGGELEFYERTFENAKAKLSKD